MRFITIVKSAEASAPPPQALMDAIAKLAEEATRSGRMVDMGGLAPTAMGTRVALRGGKVTVLDGPFTEAKEIVGGFAMWELSSKQEAIDLTLRFMELHEVHAPGWEGETEIRQVFGPGDMGPGR